VPSSDVVDPRIIFATRLLSRGLSKPADNVREVAAVLHLSNSRFRHLFKQEVGITPRRYVKQLRLQEAKRLLETSLLSVKEVTAQVGVNDLSHFARDFKSKFGINPSRLSRKYLVNSDPRPNDQIG
jgi:AraC family transcriptional regulator, arabinose operon regulatory protein